MAKANQRPCPSYQRDRPGHFALGSNLLREVSWSVPIAFGAYRLERFSEIRLQKLAEEEKNAAEELASGNAEKEQQRLRKTLVDELSNLRNSKTADEDKS